jgi:DNA-binding CsgD family transcriptional regulator
VTDDEVKTQLHTLSEREYEVLGWFAHGLSCTDIAARLVLSPKTVANHRGRLLYKLNLTKTTDLIRFAITNKVNVPILIPTPPTPPRVTGAPIQFPMIPAPMPIAYRSHRYEREEWPG